MADAAKAKKAGAAFPLHLSATELKFTVPADRKNVATQEVALDNPTDQPAVFKVKTTAPKDFLVKPCTGVVAAHQQGKVSITLVNRKEAKSCKFQVQAALLQPADNVEEFSQGDHIKTLPGERIGESVIRASVEIEEGAAEAEGAGGNEHAPDNASVASVPVAVGEKNAASEQPAPATTTATAAASALPGHAATSAFSAVPPSAAPVAPQPEAAVPGGALASATGSNVATPPAQAAPAAAPPPAAAAAPTPAAPAPAPVPAPAPAVASALAPSAVADSKKPSTSEPEKEPQKLTCLTLQVLSDQNNVSGSIVATNALDVPVVFKMKTTQPHSFQVKPTLGVIPPKNSTGISVTLIHPVAADVKVKFLIQAAPLQPHEQPPADTASLAILLKQLEGEGRVQEQKVKFGEASTAAGAAHKAATSAPTTLSAAASAASAQPVATTSATTAAPTTTAAAAPSVTAAVAKTADAAALELLHKLPSRIEASGGAPALRRYDDKSALTQRRTASSDAAAEDAPLGGRTAAGTTTPHSAERAITLALLFVVFLLGILFGRYVL